MAHGRCWDDRTSQTPPPRQLRTFERYLGATGRERDTNNDQAALPSRTPENMKLVSELFTGRTSMKTESELETDEEPSRCSTGSKSNSRAGDGEGLANIRPEPQREGGRGWKRCSQR